MKEPNWKQLAEYAQHLALDIWMEELPFQFDPTDAKYRRLVDLANAYEDTATSIETLVKALAYASVPA